MQALFFIIPFVLFVLGVGFILALSGSVPDWLNVSIGALKKEDIEGLSDKNRGILKKALLIVTIAGTIIELLIGVSGSLFFPGNIVILIVAILLQALFMFILFRPVLQSTKRLKQVLESKKAEAVETPPEE